MLLTHARRRMLAWVLRGFAAGWVLLLTLALTGAAYESIAGARAVKALMAPGRMIAVGDGMLHLHCTGSGGPTVVLEAGNVAYSATWARIQSPLSLATRVCSYDRAGLAWSQPSGAPRDGATIAIELAALLDNAGEAGPFVLVGHSMGALYVRAFAHEYPEQTAALVLVDPSHPQQFVRWPESTRGQQEWGRRMMRIAPALASVGLLRATNLFGRLGSQLPPAEYSSARHFLASASHLRVAGAELAAFDVTARQLEGKTLPEGLPVLVLSADDQRMDADMATFTATLHDELATLSHRTWHHRLHAADHYSIVTGGHYAPIVAELIGALVHLTGRTSQNVCLAGV